MKWEPAIYEHKAALIGHSPAEVAQSAPLLIEAICREHELYQSDYLTVGLDVYNLEAEALGARLTVPGPDECPDLAGRLFDLEALPAPWPRPAIPAGGRFRLLLAAGRELTRRLGDRAQIRVAASGPVSLAAKLAGLEDLLISLSLEDGRAQRLLEYTTEIAESWCNCLRQNGLSAIMFDSMASPPMFSPEMYRQYVLPLHQRLMNNLQAAGQAERALVIGGDTTPIAQYLGQTGANILVCDYIAEAQAFRAALGDDSEFQIRRNIAPASLTGAAAEAAAVKFSRELSGFSRPIAGTGILPYAFRAQDFWNFRDRVERAQRAG